MTRTDLEEYQKVVRAIKIQKNTVVTDSVVGSSVDYPYTAHSITLHGVPCDAKAIADIQRLEKKKACLDAFIDAITDERARTLLDMHYRKSHSWARVASETGYTIDSNKKYLQRFFNCPQMSPCVPI